MIRLVIYDDNQQRCESLKALFQLTDGMQCLGCFPDCSHVAEQMENFQPDVVLMDIEMPIVDGINGVGIIKKKFPAVRIIMQTVFEDEEKIFLKTAFRSRKVTKNRLRGSKNENT